VSRQPRYPSLHLLFLGKSKAFHKQEVSCLVGFLVLDFEYLSLKLILRPKPFVTKIKMNT